MNMKKIIHILSFAFLFSVGLSSCIKNEDTVWTGLQVEFDAAAYHTKSGGFPFPLLNRVPTGYGRALGTLDPVLTTINTPDTIRMRINLVGAQQSTPQTVALKVSSTYTTAVAGTHFDLIDTQVIIPANSSFGIARWVIRNPGVPPVGSPTTVQVVFELLGNATLAPSENFKYVGWTITQ
jgi:hypothetical protein